MKRRTLAQRREALGLSQPQLAELLGVSTIYVHRTEKGYRADGAPHRPRLMYDLALEAIEARARAGKLVVADRRPPGRPRKPPE